MPSSRPPLLSVFLGQLLTYLEYLLDQRPVAFGFITDGYQIVFAKGFVANGEKCYLKSKSPLFIRNVDSIVSLVSYFEASQADFGLPPSSIGPYAVGRRLGAGATSFVFVGQKTNDDQAALKMVVEANAGDLVREHEVICGVRNTIECEQSLDLAEKTAFLNSFPNMELFTYSSGSRESQAGAVTPLGELFSSRIDRRLDQQGLESILRALCAAHHAGYVHRDIRPPNLVVIESSGQVVLIDFGFAAAIGKETAYAGAPHFQPSEAQSLYKPWPMHDLAQLLQSLAYYADVLVDGIKAPAPRHRDMVRLDRMQQPENVKLVALGRLVAAASEMPTAAPTLQRGHELGSLLNCALKAALGRNLPPSSLVAGGNDDISDEQAQALREMICSAVKSASEAFCEAVPLSEKDKDHIWMCIKNRPKRTVAGRWGWYSALLAVLKLSKVCVPDECLFPKGSFDHLSLEG